MKAHPFLAAGLWFGVALGAAAQCVPVTITQQPQSRTNVCSTNCVTFTVAATGSTPLRYQWFYNGSVIPGATGSAYTVCPVTPARQGTYTVRVTNACSARVSAPAYLVVITDTTPPALTCPGDQPRGICGTSPVAVTYPSPVAADNLDPTPTVTCVPASGSLFPLGETLVRCTARDDCGNSNACTFLVKLFRDTTPPVLTCPTSSTNVVCATNAVPLNYTVTATDEWDANVTITCTPALGYPITPGTAVNVNCVARDDCGNSAVCAFSVRVIRDTQPPVLTCPTNRILYVCTNRLPVTFAPSASDNTDPTPTVSCVPPSGTLFSVGLSVVTCTASDDCENTNFCQFTVRVIQDTLSPVINCSSNLMVWANTNRVPVTFTVAALDDTDPTPTLICLPPSGSLFSNGVTVVTCLASDDCANTNACQFTVTVRLAEPDIEVSPLTLAFGDQTVGTTSAAQDVLVRNVGGSPLSLRSLATSSGDFPVSVAGGLPASLAAGASLTVQVRFAPSSTSDRTGNIAISSDDPDEASVSVACGGTGVAPDIDVNPAALTFGGQAVNTLSAPQSVMVSNTGTATLVVNSVTSSSSEFVLSGVPGLPLGVVPGGSFNFDVRFLPGNIGARNGTVSIASGDADEPTRTVNCGGTGLRPRLEVTPSQVLFGTVTLGTTARRTMELRNLGNVNLTINTITSAPPVFVFANLPPLPLTLAPGQWRTLGVEYTPQTVQSVSGSVRVESNDPFTPGIVITIGGNSAPPAGTGCGQAPVDGVEPVITSPAHESTFVFGEPIAFRAANAPNAAVRCHADCYELCWYFRKLPDPWTNGYQFTANRLLGCDRAIPLPGDYEAMVSMCGVTSAPIAFHVVLNPGITDESQRHPLFANTNNKAYRCHQDWTNAVNPNRLSTAHFNVIWTTNGYASTQTNGTGCDDLSGVALPDNRPPDRRLGLLECAWATFDHWMVSPLEDAALFQDVPEYSVLTNLTWWVGGPGGGGVSQPMGFGYEQIARADIYSWIPVHELFHTFDYAGNPLHNKRRFDHRSQGNPYVFLHEAPTRVAQTLATNSPKMIGFETDQWPMWTPVDMGFIELGYDGGIFWTFLMNAYPFAPRLTWEGPPICACAQWADPNQLPHNFRLFELWNARGRERIRAELGPGVPLTDYTCDAAHWPASSNVFFIYNGHTNPVCYQTLEYDLAVLEEILRERFAFAGSPLEESLLLDFAVNFATNFPPVSLRTRTPVVTECPDLTGLYFSQGFSDEGWADSLVCDGVFGFRTNDFYGRIQFRLLDDSLRILRLTANDEATLYVDGRAVIEPAGADFPNASTTYADQRSDGDFAYVWAGTARPQSSVFAVNDPTNRVFEIEWVNRGDGKGNGDSVSRYFLMLESCDSLDETNTVCAPVGNDQVQILSARFWSDQGSGEPGFAGAPDWHDPIDPAKEIQLRPVSSGERPFFLPPLAVNYHPVQSPTGYAGRFTVTVRHDGLTHTRPSAHLLVMTGNGLQWRGPLETINADTQQVSLQSCGDGSPATYEGDPAVIVVVARRTLHPETNGPAQFGTLGALHYTIGISRPDAPIERDRYDKSPLGNPANNTWAEATPLPHVEGGDLFTGPGRGPDRVWEMLVPDLTLHHALDQDFFRLDLPDEAGDDCLDVLPECGNGARVGNGILEVMVRGSGGTEIIAYDALGNEIARDDDYLRVGCPRETGFDPFYFSVQADGGCRLGYYLTITYSVPDAGLWERFGDRCLPPKDGGGGFDIDDYFKLINPLKVGWNEIIFGINCNPIVCQPPKSDYLLFHWDGNEPLDLEFRHAAAADFTFALLDAQFNFIAGAMGARQSGNLWAMPRLHLTGLPTGYYALRVTASQFGVPYSMRAVGLAGTELRIDPTSVALIGDEVRFSWPAEPGRRYRVQFKEHLNAPAWIGLDPEIRATSLQATFSEPVAGRPARFYRIVRLDL